MHLMNDLPKTWEGTLFHLTSLKNGGRAPKMRGYIWAPKIGRIRARSAANRAAHAAMLSWAGTRFTRTVCPARIP